MRIRTTVGFLIFLMDSLCLYADDVVIIAPHVPQRPHTNVILWYRFISFSWFWDCHFSITRKTQSHRKENIWKKNQRAEVVTSLNLQSWLCWISELMRVLTGDKLQKQLSPVYKSSSLFGANKTPPTPDLMCWPLNSHDRLNLEWMALTNNQYQ